MKGLLAIVVTGAALAATPAIAGLSGLDQLNLCIGGPLTVARCLQGHPMSAARAKKVAACILRQGSNGKSVTPKQWVACGLPKAETKLPG